MRLPSLSPLRGSLLLGALLAAPAALAQERPWNGRYELSGRYQPVPRQTRVELDVAFASGQGSYTVTRVASVGAERFTWRSTSARVDGGRLRVRFELGGGIVGNLPDGQPAHVITGDYLLTGDGRRIYERLRNETQAAPHDWWNSVTTSGLRRPAGLDPELGATSLPDAAAFDAFARRDDVPGASGVREVKLLQVGVDGPDPRLYLLNTKLVSYHYDFYLRGLGQVATLTQFNQRTYFTDARRNVAGTVLYHEAWESPSGQRGLYVLEFWPTDPVKVAHVARAFHALKAALPFAADRIAYHPAGETQEALYRDERAAYDQAGVRVISTEELFGALSYVPLNPGVGFGRLRLIDPAQPGPPAGVRDVVIFRRLPNDLSHTGGIITEAPQTPLSHVNLKAKQNRTPNAFIKDAAAHPRVAPLLGKLVRYEVGPDDFQLREATQAEAEAFLEALRPTTVTHPPRDLSATTVRPLSELGNADTPRVGAKAANVGELLRLLGSPTVPEGYGVPFALYDRFMQANGLYQRVRDMLADPAFQADPAVREQRLAALRRAIRQAPVPPDVAAKLAELQARFPQGTPIRCRSSTNNEDLPGFNGAGLYDSYTHRPDEGALENTVKQVWASLWNYRAFEEREFYRIDHLEAAMGVLVHPNFDDERCNGVAITKNPFDPAWPGFYVNAQVGESLITNPDGARPDEFLVARLGPQGEYEVQYVTRSDQVPPGQTVLTRPQVETLTRALERIQRHFKQVYQAQQDPAFAMDVEWKFDAQGRLAIKQARPVVD